MVKKDEVKDFFVVGEVATKTERVVVSGEGDDQRQYDIFSLLAEIGNDLKVIKSDLKEVLGK